MAVILLSAGCIHEKATWETRVDEKFAIKAANPDHYFIRVPHNGDYPVPPDGRVTVTYRVKEKVAEKYWKYRYADGVLASGYGSNIGVIYVIKDNRIVKRIALTPLKDFLSRYTRDDQGYWVIKVD